MMMDNILAEVDKEVAEWQEAKRIESMPHVYAALETLCDDPAEDNAINVVKVIAKEVKEIPVSMILYCPFCGGRHIDEGEWETKIHRSHLCNRCGLIWRPADIPTVGTKEISTQGKNDTIQKIGVTIL